MKRNIGEVIRSLRKERQITQEKLAEALGVSFQSVSRWENGLAYPDITLVPILARFFNVSTDTLFAIENEDLQKRHSEFESTFLQLRSTGNMENCISLMQEARKEFPRDYHFMMNLAECMEIYADGTTAQKDIYRKENYAKQIHTLCQQVLDDCNADAERHRAIQMLCNYYSMTGNISEALHLLEGVADMKHSRELVMGNLLCGKEKLSVDEKILYITTSIRLYEALFPDGNYLYYHRSMCWNYRRLTELYLLQNDVEGAYQALLVAEKHAIEFDGLTGELTDDPICSAYTSPFAYMLKYVPEEHTKHWVGTERRMLLYRLKELQGYWGEHEGINELKERLEKATCGEKNIDIE